MNAETRRMLQDRDQKDCWRKFGPYLADRQWGTVREDYSANGDAWNYLTHDMARSKAYRWGEDGLAGICDDQQLLCFAWAFWNKKDPIIKERLFGLTNSEGNHGEDCKEQYYYLDSTPTHSYMKMLYKYPQHEFPYEQLVRENKSRDRYQNEFELLDTAVLRNDQYFDVYVEYAKAGSEDILIRLTVFNRSSEAAPLVILPHIWFRNTWAWKTGVEKPEVFLDDDGVLQAKHSQVGVFRMYAETRTTALFCENETNVRRLYGQHSHGVYKDGINDYIVHDRHQAVYAHTSGTKAAFHYDITIPAHQSIHLQFRICKDFLLKPFEDFDSTFADRKREADEFYNVIQKNITEPALRNVQRQAFAGMLWSKQFYYFDIGEWLRGDPLQPPPAPQRKRSRNHDWPHLNNAEILSMPDKWEYPWYAAWDLAFHTLPLAVIDPEFAKNQLRLLAKEWYMHPNGQLPAYEWNFSDVNPPVHGWATWRVYKIDAKVQGKPDRAFLEEVFHKLLLNFTWWVNKKDHNGNNIFQGGFLGMDNIGVFDRNTDLGHLGHLEQSDGTSWMAMFTLNMLRMSLELAKENPVYQNLATKFFEHFLYIAGAMTNVNNEGISLWDDEDEFFYDVIHCPSGDRLKMKVRSMVGLVPLFAVEVLDEELFQSNPGFTERLMWFLKYRPDLANLISRWQERGKGERHLLSLLRGHRMKKLLKRMLDESEFLSPFGIRALSKVHEHHPYTLKLNGNQFTVKYVAAESDSGMFGGNSNWRGPIWFPVNYLIIESLEKFHHYYGDDFKVEHPIGSGQMLTLRQIADELSSRLISLFMQKTDGVRPFQNHPDIEATDPHFQHHILFYEYFDGDNGRGLGASHQTGWTGLVAKLIQHTEADAGRGMVTVNSAPSPGADFKFIDPPS